MFDFNVTNSQINSKGGNYFKPYTINKIDTIKVETKDGEKKDGSKWLALNVTYSLTDGGSISKMYFYDDNDKDGTTRGEYQGNPCFPASYEVIKQLAIHVLGNYNLTNFEKFKKLASKIRTMGQFIDTFIKLTNSAPKNDNLYIKVIGRNNQGTIYSDLPNTCAVSKGKDGKYVHTDENGRTVGNDTYPINFLSDKENGLTFTANELKKQAELAKAKPTKIETKEEEEETNVDGIDDDLDLEDLDNLDDELAKL